MAGYFNKQTLEFVTMLFLVWLPLNSAFPSPATDDKMVHNNNYDMIMLDTHEPAVSMHYQNFDEFFNAEKADNDAMSEMQMDESHIASVFLAPQPLNNKEKRSRTHLEHLDVQREKRVQRSLAKSATMPRNNAYDWDKFHYDMFVSH